ncbi:MAG: DUF5799 family protein [Haloarculaceae archaeon]
MSNDWTSAVAAERMEVDREFGGRIDASEFSRQQWGLVMTAVEFEIENPDDPEAARIVADTENLPAIMPQLDRIEKASAGPGPSGGGSGGSDGGLLGGVKDALGLGGGEDPRRETAAELAQEYADELQEKLEEKGRWESVRKLA